MTRLRWREPGSEGNFNRWIRGVLTKEMVLAHSSYARAAGLQSEINKVTVTRVAGSEVEFKRLMNLYRKDMVLTVNDIKREQKQLRKSIRRYSQKMSEGRRERRKREKESQELDRKNAENMSRIAAIFMMGEVPVQILKIKREEKDVSPDSGIEEDDPGQRKEMNEEEKREKEEMNYTETKKDVLPRVVYSDSDSYGKHLPSIVESDEREEEDKMETDKEADDIEQPSIFPDSPPDNNESAIILQERTLKPKRQVVSFSDLIKLQHTTSTKKLFNLVNILAKQHGIGEKEKERESRNSSVNRGSTEESNASLRAASVLYPIKYGYNSQDPGLLLPPLEGAVSDTDDHDSSLSTDWKSDPSEGKSGSRLTKSDLYSPGNTNLGTEIIDSPDAKLNKNGSHSAKKFRKRNKSLPSLIDNFQKLKLEQAQKATQKDGHHSRRYSLIGTSGVHVTNKPRTLPPLQKLPSDLTMSQPRGRSKSISWTEAFGLLKGVHSLHSQDDF